jgi:hypothetical protein
MRIGTMVAGYSIRASATAMSSAISFLPVTSSQPTQCLPIISTPVPLLEESAQLSQIAKDCCQSETPSFEIVRFFLVDESR